MRYFRKYYKTMLLLMQVGIFFTCNPLKNDSSFLQVNTVVSDSLPMFHETGQLESIETFNINVPMRWNMEYRIVRLAPEGSFVQPGDTVVHFDMQPLQDRLSQAKKELQKVRQELKQVLEQNALALETQYKTIERLKMQYQIDSTRLANARYESKTTREQFALELEKTRLQLQRALQNLEAQKIINAAKERLKRIKIEQARIKLDRILLMKDEMNLISDHAGIVIYPYYRSSGRKVKIKEGEVLFPGSTVIQVANLKRMKAVVTINEVDRSFIKEGQKVKITVVAYPDTVFSGEVVNIARVATEERKGSTVKVYPVDVYLDSGANYRLKPGLSVRAGIILDTLKNTFRVPNWCLFQKTNQTWIEPLGQKKIPVELIFRMDGFSYVRGALRDGMVLKSNRMIYE